MGVRAIKPFMILTGLLKFCMWIPVFPQSILDDEAFSGLSVMFALFLLFFLCVCIYFLFIATDVYVVGCFYFYLNECQILFFYLNDCQIIVKPGMAVTFEYHHNKLRFFTRV